MRSLRLWVVLAALLASAQVPAKRPLTHQDCDSWRNIFSTQLSPNGKYLAYALFPQEGDGELVVRDLATGQERREPIGVRPPPPPPNPENPESRPEPPGIRLSFSADNRTLVFTTFPLKADTDKARKEKKKPEEMPKGGLVIMDLASASVTRVANVAGFQVPEKAGGFVAYLREPSPEKSEKKEATPPADQGRRGGGTRATSSSPAREFGSDLVLRSLADNQERTFANVTEYSLSKDAKTLVYAVSSKKPEENGAFAVSTANEAAPTPLIAAKAKYAKLTWDEAQTELAFVGNSRVYLWDRQSPAAKELPLPKQEFVPSDKGAVNFSKDGRHLFLGCAPPAKSEKKADAEVPDDKAVFDLWHWKDDYIQPMQKVRANLERSRSYRAVVHLAGGKFVQLADRTMPDLVPSDDGLHALGSDDRAYRRMIEYDQRYADSYLVDTVTGERRLVVKKNRGMFTWSPDGRHALFFDGRDWNSLSVPEGSIVDLTGKLGVNFWNEDHDTPGTPQSYGSAGWTRDGRYVLLYDRYDVWQMTPDGSEAKNLTGGAGRQQHLQFRYVRLDTNPEDRGIDPAQPLLLHAENLDTHDTGFYRDRIEGGEPPRKLLFAPKYFTNPIKARDANVLALTASRFDEFPDLLITDNTFRELRKVSDANPQRKQLLWGTAELVPFKNLDGVPLEGALYKPENFDPHQKYPLLVYIYERLSQNVHHFVDPRPSHSINVAYYVSNGYLVFTPDIAYTVGYPGQSALKCVLPGIQAVVDRGYVDEKAIGIQGHSWGGYQIAYMVTQTSRFRAAAAGAPVADMISAYDGIRWGPGLPRQFQYERTQSRIGGSLWQYPRRFIENSPIFMADRVATPLLMLHNDADDAVPWYQGVEYYLALRRLGKEAYLFVYNGEPHGLRKRANQKDYTMRLQQFFDHYLKGAPEPEWMARGLPFIEKQ